MHSRAQLAQHFVLNCYLYFPPRPLGLDKQPALEAALAQNVKALLPPSLSPAQDTRRVLGLQGDAAITPAQAANVAARVHEEYLAGANLTQDKKPFIKVSVRYPMRRRLSMPTIWARSGEIRIIVFSMRMCIRTPRKMSLHMENKFAYCDSKECKMAE